jgi:hypothetical protein
VFLGGVAAALGGAASAQAAACCAASQDAAPRPPDSDVQATLARLLAANRELYHPIWGDGFANHLSMELCALAALGATSQRLDEFSNSYSQNLIAFPRDGISVSKDTWRAQLGNADALRGFARYFAGELRSRGRDDVLREVLGVFAPSISSELFHCLIRTAYGVQFDDDDEVAHGLAYWSIKEQPLGALSESQGTEYDFASLLARVRATPALAGARFTGSSNPGRMQQASRLEGFATITDSLAVDDKTLDRIARATLELFAATRNFTALHAVTSTHALRILLPYFPERALATRYHAQALIAAYVRMGAPTFEVRSSNAAAPWDATIAKAIASADDHDAKFVYACRDEQSARGGELYRIAAARRVDRA